MTEIQGKSILVRVGEDSSYRESTVYQEPIILQRPVFPSPRGRQLLGLKEKRKWLVILLGPVVQRPISA